ncbi:hypothetical protein pb186bvf_017934 [Paramecium bursaria]
MHLELSIFIFNYYSIYYINRSNFNQRLILNFDTPFLNGIICYYSVIFKCK